MKVTRYFESLSNPNDTMFIEINEQHRFTRRGKDWVQFRNDLTQLIKDTISEDFAEKFTEATEDWVSNSVEYA